MVKYRPPAIPPDDTPLDEECRRIFAHIVDDLNRFLGEGRAWDPCTQDDFVQYVRDSLYSYVNKDGDIFTKYRFRMSIYNCEQFTLEIEVYRENYVASRIITLRTELPNFKYSIRKVVEEGNEDMINLKTKLGDFYNAYTISEICSPKVQQYILSPDVNDSVEYEDFTMQDYLDSMIQVDGGCRSSGLTYHIWGNPISFSLRLYDIDKIGNVSSKASKKFFNKATKKFKLVDALYKRLLRINNAVLAFYIADDRNSMYADFASAVRNTHLNEYLKFDIHHSYVDHSDYSAEMIWLPYILPYIRFNLIEALEIMGSSYYDHEYTDPEKEYDNWLTPLREMFDDVVYHYEMICGEIKYKQIVPLSYDMIRKFLNTDHSLPSVHFETIAMMHDMYSRFYNHNEIESILVLDYAMGIYQSIGYIMSNADMSDYHKGAMLANLYDMVTSIEECIMRYNDIDKYMLNDLTTLTWSYNLAFISKYRSAATDEYLKPGISFFGKRKSKNPHGLYKKPVNFRKNIFSEFEDWISNKIILGKDVY